MALFRRRRSAVDAGKVLASNEYLQRFAEDPELREHVLTAYESGRKAYTRMANGKGPAAVMEDKKVQRELRQAAASLTEAAERLRGKRRRRKRRGRKGLLLVLGLAGAGAAVALNEDLRQKVLDTVFGAEEEFEYTSTTDGGGAGAESTTPVGAPPS